MQTPPTLTQMIANTHLFTDAVEYVMVRVPKEFTTQVVREAWGDGAFWALIRDKDETSLLISRGAWERSLPSYAAGAISPVYRLITLDIPLDFGLIGYLAVWTAVLAEAGISILTLSAFSRDHLFVPAVDFDRAWALLEGFICSSYTGG